MTAPTPSAGEWARAQAIVAEWYPAISPKLYREKLAESIAQSLATARAEGAQAERAWIRAIIETQIALALEEPALAGEATDG